MLLTAANMEEAGNILAKNPFYTNDQLTLVIEATNHALKYFEARGEYFGLVNSCLRVELETLKDFQRMRNDKRKM